MNQYYKLMLKSFIIAVLIGLTITIPFAQGIMQDECSEARADADRETSGILWFMAGCCIGGLGVLGAYVIKPSPPAVKLMGKTPEYVASYTDCYKDEAQGIQTKWAWIGCGAVAVVYLAYYIIAIAIVNIGISVLNSTFSRNRIESDMTKF